MVTGGRSMSTTLETVSTFPLCIVVVIISLLCLMSTTEAAIRSYTWDVKYEKKSPDCFKKAVITINGMSPGPTITAVQGDIVVVHVTNNLVNENLTLHWHGIRQIGTPWFDGTESISQCPILPGETFDYQFKVDRAGTYMYHSHHGMQKAAGLNGMIKVFLPNEQSEPFSYDFDQSILLMDWYHKSIQEQATGLSSIPFVFVGEPQSLLIHGRGRFNCSSLINSSSFGTDICDTSSPDCTPYVLTVTPGKTYRLRIGSLTALSALNFEIEGHNMTVVETDGHLVEPFEVRNLFIYSGETYSVLVTANQDPSRNYWTTVNVVCRNPGTPTGLAIFNYKPNNPEESPPTVPTTGPMWNDTDSMVAQSLAIKARQGYIEPTPKRADRLMVFLNTQNKINGYVRWSVNNVSHTLPTFPYLAALKDKRLSNKLHEVFEQEQLPATYDIENYDVSKVAANVNATLGNSIYHLGYSMTVDIVLQNSIMMQANHTETHPWHLHGHDFWVLGYGRGKFDPSKDPQNFNLVNPIQKNTVPVHFYGWTAIRFRANNPGVWLFHCHLEAHHFLGMWVVFEEGIDRVPNLPSSVTGCVSS